MAESRRFPTHLEDFVLWQERKLEQEQENDGNSALVRKVTLRIGLAQYVALRMLARRYGVSVTALGEKLLESAAYDAADLAGIQAETLMEETEAEVKAWMDPLKVANDRGETPDLMASLKEHGLSMAPVAMEDR